MKYLFSVLVLMFLSSEAFTKDKEPQKSFQTMEVNKQIVVANGISMFDSFQKLPTCATPDPYRNNTTDPNIVTNKDGSQTAGCYNWSSGGGYYLLVGTRPNSTSEWTLVNP